ncbi:MAG TPA: hypothetical protein VEX66_04315 [Microlunatus sp.]|nr:hypothetical protein [Microlunatus sp.]
MTRAALGRAVLIVVSWVVDGDVDNDMGTSDYEQVPRPYEEQRRRRIHRGVLDRMPQERPAIIQEDDAASSGPH